MRPEGWVNPYSVLGMVDYENDIVSTVGGEELKMSLAIQLRDEADGLKEKELITYRYNPDSTEPTFMEE